MTPRAPQSILVFNLLSPQNRLITTGYESGDKWLETLPNSSNQDDEKVAQGNLSRTFVACSFFGFFFSFAISNCGFHRNRDFSVMFMHCWKIIDALSFAVLFPRKLTPKLPVVNLATSDLPTTKPRDRVKEGNTHILKFTERSDILPNYFRVEKVIVQRMKHIGVSKIYCNTQLSG